MAAIKVSYEWSLETLDGDDVVDSDFNDTLDAAWLGMENTRVCLVRHEGNATIGVTDRLWAYIGKDGLATNFETADNQPTGYLVPKKFWNEYIAAINSL